VEKKCAAFEPGFVIALQPGREGEESASQNWSEKWDFHEDPD
jgi:hypothetical protein